MTAAAARGFFERIQCRIVGQFELQVWAETDPTVVAYGTPAIDVKLPLQIATANVASWRECGH
jgi:hypothetical protein